MLLVPATSLEHASRTCYKFRTCFSYLLWACPTLGLARKGSDDVTVTRVHNGHDAAAKVLTAGGSQLVVGTREVEDSGLSEHGVVLDFGLGQWGAVGSNDNQLGLSGAESLQRGLVTKSVLTTLDDQTQTLTDRLLGVLGLVSGHHFGRFFGVVI